MCLNAAAVLLITKTLKVSQILTSSRVYYLLLAAVSSKWKHGDDSRVRVFVGLRIECNFLSESVRSFRLRPMKRTSERTAVDFHYSEYGSLVYGAWKNFLTDFLSSSFARARISIASELTPFSAFKRIGVKLGRDCGHTKLSTGVELLEITILTRLIPLYGNSLKMSLTVLRDNLKNSCNLSRSDLLGIEIPKVKD